MTDKADKKCSKCDNISVMICWDGLCISCHNEIACDTESFIQIDEAILSAIRHSANELGPDDREEK